MHASAYSQHTSVQRCLDEVCASIDLHGAEEGFDVMLSLHEEWRMRATFAEQFSVVVKAASSIDVELAEVTNEPDKVRTFNKIRNRTGGFEGFNSILRGAMVGWLLRQAKNRWSRPELRICEVHHCLCSWLLATRRFLNGRTRLVSSCAWLHCSCRLLHIMASWWASQASIFPSQKAVHSMQPWVQWALALLFSHLS